MGDWRNCGDELNITSAFAMGFGRGMSFLRGLAGFNTFISIAESTSSTNGTGVVYAGFLRGVKNNV